MEQFLKDNVTSIVNDMTEQNDMTYDGRNWYIQFEIFSRKPFSGFISLYDDHSYYNLDDPADVYPIAQSKADINFTVTDRIYLTQTVNTPQHLETLVVEILQHFL